MELPLKSKIAIAAIVLIVFFLVTRPKGMPEVSLIAFNGANQVEKGSRPVGGGCAAEKCLVVYVAPWCPACRQATTMINGLTKSVESAGYNTQVIVGSDHIDALKLYAAEFSDTVLLDVNRQFFSEVNVKAVPYFAVIDWRGNILKELRGGSLDVGVMRNRLEL